MNRRLLRPTAALFPLACLIAAGIGRAELPVRLLEAYYLVQLFSLCAADCFRNAAAREPGVRRVDRRFGGALAQLIAGVAILCLLLALDVLPLDGYMLAAAALISIEHLFEERMYALARPVDGAILSMVANGLLLAGLLLDGGAGLTGPLPSFFALCGAGLGALIAAATAYAVEPAHGFSIKPVNLPRAPRTCLQTLLYPAVHLAYCAAANQLPNLARFGGEARLLAFPCGLILWRLARTVCRRSVDESRPLNLLLIALAALSIAVAAWMPDYRACALAAELALICSAAVFCAPSVRLWSGIALTAAALALALANPFAAPLNAIAVTLCAAAAAIPNLKHAFLKRV